MRIVSIVSNRTIIGVVEMALWVLLSILWIKLLTCFGIKRPIRSHLTNTAVRKRA